MKVVHNVGTNLADSMSAVAIAQRLEQKERARGYTAPAARSRLADKLRIGIGTLENIIRDRVKRIDGAVRDRLHGLLIREIEAEIARLTAELELARQSGAHPGSDEVAEVEGFLQAAKSMMGGWRK